MSLGHYVFSDLETLMERVHGLFDQWEKDLSPTMVNDPWTFYRAKLAVHEWLANLVQHADFGERTPEIQIEISPNGSSVSCMIQDNSRGFDLNEELKTRKEVLSMLPDRGMGLLMLHACTHSLTYKRLDDSAHRLEFTVSSDPDACFQIPFEM